MDKKLNEMRLSDRVLFALNLALEQNDVVLAEMLASVLEVSITRNAGGSKFVERRNYPEEVVEAFSRLADLKEK